MKWHQWILLGLGVWLMIAPWVLGFSQFNLALWHSVGVGIAVIFFTWCGVQPPSVLE